MTILNEPITEEWLREVGFKWHQFNRQPDKQWLLWLGDACRTGQSFEGTEDIGIELAAGRDGWWFCWLRSDCAHRYSRFLHVRHMRVRGDVIRLVVAITDQSWEPKNHRFGSCLKPDQAERARLDDERLDRRMMLQTGHPWRDVEKDDSRGGALPEHMQGAIDGGQAK
jgi:hypothetical protein